MILIKKVLWKYFLCCSQNGASSIHVNIDVTVYFSIDLYIKECAICCNFFCTELFFLPLVLLLYFHFINERIVPTFSYLSTQERMSYIILSCSTIKSRFLFGLYAVQTITSDTSLTIASYT